MQVEACPVRPRRWEAHDEGRARVAHPPFAVSCCGVCWEDGDGVLEVKGAVVAGLVEVGNGGGSNPAVKDEQVRRFLLLARMGSCVALRKVIPPAADVPGGCVCVRRFDMLESSPHRR